MKEKKGIKYDIIALNRDVSIIDVLNDYCNAGITDGGKRQICCIGRDHVDSHPSMKVYTETNSCYCFSCNTKFRPIDVVCESMELDPSQKYRAAQSLIDTYHLPLSDYSDYRKGEDLKNDDKGFNFSAYEMSLIGLPGAFDRKLTMDYGEGRAQTIGIDTLADLYETDREAVLLMIAPKAMEAVDYYRDRYEVHRRWMDEFEEEYGDRIRQIQKSPIISPFSMTLEEKYKVREDLGLLVRFADTSKAYEKAKRNLADSEKVLSKIEAEINRFVEDNRTPSGYDNKHKYKRHRKTNGDREI